jgi:acetyl esterase/lipase
LIISAEHDPLVDENEAYAKRLVQDGVATEYVCFPGMLHPFFTLGGVIDDAAEAEDLIVRTVRPACNLPRPQPAAKIQGKERTIL